MSPPQRTSKIWPSLLSASWPAFCTRAKSPLSRSRRCISPASSATTRSCTSSSPSPKSAPSPRPKQADAEIAAGKYRGPLHGIPWGAKDLLAVKGYPTTWGAGGFEHQNIDEDATVVKRLDAPARCWSQSSRSARWPWATSGSAGSTRNPWNPSARLERILGGTGQRRRCRMRRLRHRLRDAGLHLFAIDALRDYRPPPHLRLRAAHRRHGPELDDGQARPHRPLRRRLRARAERDPRP